MLDTDESTLQTTLKHLKQAMHNHELWHKEITRTIIGRLPCEQRDVAEDAHHHCSFGNWYYQQLPAPLRNHPSFTPIRVAHRHIHQSASRLLHKLVTEETLQMGDYDNFIASLERFRATIKTLEREVEGQLYHYDPLTGAGTQKVMLVEMDKLAELARQNIQSCCIGFMILDHIKYINKIHGRDIGDTALTAAVHFIKEQLRPFDSIFCYDSDTFLIAMPNTDLKTAHMIIERLRVKLSTAPLAYDDSRPIFMTASFGLSLLEPSNSAEINIQHAHHAAILAQSAGGNTSQIWCESNTLD